MTGVSLTEKTHKEEGHVKTETKAMLPKAKEHQRLLATIRGWKRPGRILP